MGHRPDNPAGDALGQALGRQQAIVQHMRALPHGAVADALATVGASQAGINIRRTACKLFIHSALQGTAALCQPSVPARTALQSTSGRRVRVHPAEQAL